MKGTYPKNRAVVAAFAAFAWFGLLLQLFLTVQSTVQSGRGVGWGLVIYLGYFTILTNLLVCLTLTLPLVAPSVSAGRFFARSDVNAGVATSIIFVGLAYYFLLRNVWNPQGLNLLANAILHYATPVAFLAYWWFAFPKGALRWSYPVIWGIYPTTYLIYILIRGEIIGGHYPYGFIDPSTIGYPKTVINGVGLLVVFIALGLILVALGRMQRRVNT
jgi:hypothetical protein